MSNSFPKVSADGCFIVFVQARNGQLMRPDGKLYIVPAEGGEARLMRANTPLMNSWHSFSPNGRWLVFSSKSRSPYTQMFLTHVDEQGSDTPAILVENSKAANRAVNIPEFVNMPPDGFLKIEAPVTDYYHLIDVAAEAMNRGQHAETIPLLEKALESNPGDAVVHNSLGSALAATGRLPGAVAQYRKATKLSPDYPDAHNNLASALDEEGEGVPRQVRHEDVGQPRRARLQGVAWHRDARTGGHVREAPVALVVVQHVVAVVRDQDVHVAVVVVVPDGNAPGVALDACAAQTRLEGHLDEQALAGVPVFRKEAVEARRIAAQVLRRGLPSAREEDGGRRLGEAPAPWRRRSGCV
jgi:tetratricopeptide (TPR) repeat protein